MTRHTNARHSGNDWILWVLLATCCLIAIFIAFPVTKALTGEMFIALVVTLIVAAILCIVVWQIWTQLDTFKGKRKDDELPVESPDAPSGPTIEIYNHNINVNANVASAGASSFSSADASATSESNPNINVETPRHTEQPEEPTPVADESDASEENEDPMSEPEDSDIDPLDAEEMHIRKLVSEIPDASKERVPFDIRTDDGLFILVMLREAGFLDDEFWPVFGDQKTNVSFMAMCIASSLRLPEYGRWAMFEKFWNTSNLGNLYNKSKKDGFRNANEVQRGVVGVFRNAIKLNENLDTAMLYEIIKDCPD